MSRSRQNRKEDVRKARKADFPVGNGVRFSFCRAVSADRPDGGEAGREPLNPKLRCFERASNKVMMILIVLQSIPVK